jgi:hypothetical protein
VFTRTERSSQQVTATTRTADGGVTPFPSRGRQHLRAAGIVFGRRCAGAFLPFSYEVMLVTYATVQFFDASRNLGMLVTTDCLRAWTFGSDSIVGDPAQIRPGETVVFDEVRDGNAIIAVNIRRI